MVNLQNMLSSCYMSRLLVQDKNVYEFVIIMYKMRVGPTSGFDTGNILFPVNENSQNM